MPTTDIKRSAPATAGHPPARTWPASESQTPFGVRASARETCRSLPSLYVTHSVRPLLPLPPGRLATFHVGRGEGVPSRLRRSTASQLTTPNSCSKFPPILPTPSPRATSTKTNFEHNSIQFDSNRAQFDSIRVSFEPNRFNSITIEPSPNRCEAGHLAS